MNALVSVVMPAYNCALYIGKAVESILNQTYSNFELLIWDDGSTDETIGKVQTFSDPRIAIYQNFENKGYPSVMNSLFGVAQGSFVMIQDADDWAHPDRIMKLMEVIATNPGIDLAGSHLIKIYQDGKSEKVHSELSIDRLNRSFSQYSRPDITFGTLLMRRNVTKIPFRNLMFVSRAQDIDWLFNVSEHHRFMNCDEYLYYYRQHDQSMSNANNREHLYNYFFWEYICFITQARREKGIDLLQPAYEAQLLDFLSVLVKNKKTMDPVFWERHLVYRAMRYKNWSEAVALSLRAIKLDPTSKAGYQCLYKILRWHFQKLFHL